MVSVALVGVAAAFTFSIQVRSSAAFRDQSNVSEAQQGLRAASELLGRDLRSAGRRVTVIKSPALGGGTVVAPILVDNDAWDGTDAITILYADANGETYVPDNGGVLFDPESSPVASSAGYAAGERIFFARAPTGGSADPIGAACLVQLSGAGVGVLQHSSAVAPWNAALACTTQIPSSATATHRSKA